jgi:hypothetical protein
MRLRTICETRMFHGTPDLKQILKTGLMPGLGEYKRDANYLGSLRQALAYGKYIIEVDVDANEDSFIDEDAIISLADPNDPNWVNQIENLPSKLGPLLHKIAMQEGGWEAGHSDITLVDLIRKHNLQPPSAFSDSRGNIAIPKNIGFDGPTKIIAIYHLELVGEPHKYGNSQYQVVKILYGNGSLHVGDTVIGSNEKWFVSQ